MDKISKFTATPKVKKFFFGKMLFKFMTETTKMLVVECRNRN